MGIDCNKQVQQDRQRNLRKRVERFLLPLLTMGEGFQLTAVAQTLGPNVRMPYTRRKACTNDVIVFLTWQAWPRSPQREGLNPA